VFFYEIDLDYFGVMPDHACLFMAEEFLGESLAIVKIGLVGFDYSAAKGVTDEMGGGVFVESGVF